ncbi:oxidoreductase [Robertmurraya korlensis]|uniref:oxidoreductase n=1 Tax=Robertmurraya korlensis TaxID=519977 RepID=UPI000824CEF2|nr:oxidoreductase [Robertmurraya korlensis]
MGDKKIAIVTGASSGFGMLTSIELAKQNYYVLATMRNVNKKVALLEKAEEAAVTKMVEIYPLDVTDENSILALKEKLKKLGRVDVLVNNAGFAGAGFSEEIPIEEYRQQFETNVFGAISVTQLCLPYMRFQKTGKIINVSSISGRVGFPGLSPYVASKHALEGWSESLRLEVHPFGVDVVLVEPGSFQTSIWSSGKYITERSLQNHSPYSSYMKKLSLQLEKGEASYGDPIEVAKLITEICQKSTTKLRYPIGKGVRLTLFLKGCLPWRIWERIVMKKIQ